MDITDTTAPAGRMIAIESGRLMLMPVRRRLNTPMSESFAVLPVPMRSKWVQVNFAPLPNRPKHCTTRITVRTDLLLDADAVVSSVAPFLYVGDPVFYFTSIESRQGTYQRAIQCCEPPKHVGSFRTDSGEIASCIRIGAKNATYELIQKSLDDIELRFELLLKIVDETPLAAGDLDAGHDG